MSKIQINELNVNASEFSTLNAAETTEVVGGGYPAWAKKYVLNYTYAPFTVQTFDNDVNTINQSNQNYTSAAVLGGGKKSNTSFGNSTNQQNFANINS